MRWVFYLLPIIIAVSFVSASADIQVDPASIFLNDNGKYVPYKLSQDANTVTGMTREGAFVFNKSSCSLSFYNNTNANGTPVLQSSYAVLASQGNTNNWITVDVINNAVCNTSVSENNGQVTVTGTKSVSGAGIFSVSYLKTPTQPIKITYSATNNNPAWTNFHIGLRETDLVQRFLTLGNQTFDLSQYNNTVLSRAWISSHNAQLLRLSNNSHYDMGLGWNNANSIAIHWINSQAILTIDYTFNTPILSPGQTITVDPAIASDTSTTCNTDGATTCNITIGSNSNRAVFVHLHEWKNANSNSFAASTVKIGTNSFTKLLNKTGDGSVTSLNTEVWYLAAPPTGAQTVTITWAVAPTNSIIGIVSLYNVDQAHPVNTATANSTGGANTQNPLTINIAPTHNNSWIVAEGSTSAGIGSPNKSAIYTEIIDSGGQFYGSSQYNSVPTIGSKNSFTWSTTTSSSIGRSAIAYEVNSAIHAPNTPVITHANTLNSTAIKVDWPAVTNATWYWMNATLSGGSTTHINTTSTTNTLNNYTAGSKYTISLVAANATGKSSGSVTKFNYTENIAPTSLTASNIGTTTARVSWTNPSGNFSGFKIEQQPQGGSWSTVVSNTNNSTNHRDLSGLTQGIGYGIRISTNYATGSNYSGTSSPSSILNFTTNQSTVAIITLGTNVVGDVIQINTTTHVTAGSPSPVTLKTVKIYRNGTLYNTTTLNHPITTGSSYNYTYWYQYLNNNNQTWHVKAVVTNFTGLSGETQLTFGSTTNSSKHRQYTPDYFTATDPTLGTVNYTITRPTPTSIILAANRNVGGSTFPMECLYQTSSQAITGGSSGTWVNKSTIGYWYQNQPVSSHEVYYITCYDPNMELFNTKSLVNGSFVLFGIQGFDNTFGAFLGLPVGVFFVVMAAALGNRRTAPMWVVIILAIAGLMATIGFFTLDQNVWYLAIIAGLLGLFVGRKLF